MSTNILNTKYFGEIELNDTKPILFMKGLLGIEEYIEFTLFGMPNNEKIFCLQSLEEQNVAFLLVRPWDFFPDYDIDVADDELSAINCSQADQLAVFSIITLGEDIKKTTTNLLAPIIINMEENKAIQSIVNDANYHTKHFVFPQEGDM